MPAPSVSAPRRALVSAAGPALVARGLRKEYRTRAGRHAALDGLDLTVPSGGVHGFLGPNGSGKTTTIRAVLGLLRPDAGEVSIFGARVPERLPQVIDRIGAIVEQPKFFPTFSAEKNLQLLAAAIDTPRQRVGEVLEEVGLASRRRDAFRTYSLGMKQRLAIAATLLKDPELLIFDEPTNGLDPAGIAQIRATLRGLAERGKTVLMSSHILTEVQQVADTVSIIGRGRLLAEGDVDDILATGTHAVRVGIADPRRAAEVLTGAGFVVAPGPERTLVVTAAPPARAGDLDPADLTQLLAEHGLYVRELLTQRADLESVFLELTGRSEPPPTPGADRTLTPSRDGRPS